MRRFYSCVLAVIFTATFASAQTAYTNGALAAKKRFTDRELMAITEPYVGVRTAEGIQPGLFKITPPAKAPQPLSRLPTRF